MMRNEIFVFNLLYYSVLSFILDLCTLSYTIDLVCFLYRFLIFEVLLTALKTWKEMNNRNYNVKTWLWSKRECLKFVWLTFQWLLESGLSMVHGKYKLVQAELGLISTLILLRLCSRCLWLISQQFPLPFLWSCELCIFF